MTIEIKSTKGPSTKWFTFLTVAYLLAVMIGAWMLDYFDSRGAPISPSEWGDVLAGVFSPLAFLWLLYASLSQRAELELQRAELRQNNVTQNEQRVEMQKQVEAMTAQAKLLEAQAAATFDPVFTVRQVANRQKGYMLTIDNRGCEVTNVCMEGDFDVVYYNGGSSGFDSSEKEIYYWSTDSAVTCKMHAMDPAAFYKISIQYTRKDGAAKRNVYYFSVEKQSLRLGQSEQVMPSAGA